MIDETLTMIPGPTPVHGRVLDALARPTTSHVAPSFVSHFREALAGFRSLCRSEEGQPFVVDVVLELELDTVSDDLSRTVSYADIADEVESVITGEPRDLIETVAGEIASRCLSHGRVERVTVTVHKPQAPLTQSFSDVSVTISRSRHV